MPLILSKSLGCSPIPVAVSSKCVILYYCKYAIYQTGLWNPVVWRSTTSSIHIHGAIFSDHFRFFNVLAMAAHFATCDAIFVAASPSPTKPRQPQAPKSCRKGHCWKGIIVLELPMLSHLKHESNSGGWHRSGHEKKKTCEGEIMLNPWKWQTVKVKEWSPYRLIINPY